MATKRYEAITLGFSRSLAVKCGPGCKSGIAENPDLGSLYSQDLWVLWKEVSGPAGKTGEGQACACAGRPQLLSEDTKPYHCPGSIPPTKQDLTHRGKGTKSSHPQGTICVCSSDNKSMSSPWLKGANGINLWLQCCTHEIKNLFTALSPVPRKVHGTY